MKIDKPNKNVPKIATISLALQFPLQSNCGMCANLKSSCKGHRHVPKDFGKFQRCNAICLTYETTDRMTFKQELYSTPDLDLSQNDETFVKNYQLPDNDDITEPSCVKYGESSLLNRSSEGNPIRLLLKDLLTEKQFLNTTVIGNGKWLHLIFIELLLMKVQLTAINCDGLDLKMLQADRNHIRFLSLDSFLGSTVDIQTSPFFPWSINFPYFYDKDKDSVPNYLYFISPNQSLESIESIKLFCLSFIGNWNFKEQLILTLKEQSKKLLDLALEINDEAFQIQNTLKLDLLNSVALQSCFSYATWHSFFYNLLGNHSLGQYSLHVVENPEKGNLQ